MTPRPLRTSELDVPDAPPAHTPVADNTIEFPDGIPGFESCRRFVLLASEEAAPLQRLDAVDGPAASFLGVDPRLVFPTYRCRLNDSELRRLKADETTTLVWLALVMVEADGTVAVNLRAPIVINPERMIGCQSMPDSGLYPIRHVLTLPGM